MVLGLIDFLLGGKKKTKVPRTAQVTTSSGGASNPGAVQQNGGNNTGNVPNGVDNTTSNSNNQGQSLEFQDSNKDDSGAAANSDQNSNTGSKKSVADVINKIHQELKATNESVVNIVTDIKEIQNNVNTIDHRVSELESGNKQFNERLSEIDENMGKFLSLYELVNNQYNPFVEKEAPKQKEIVLGSEGNSQGSGESDDEGGQDNIKEKLGSMDESRKANIPEDMKENLESSLLELDTLDIEAAAADAVPLTHLKSNTNSLVVILSWLEYLVKKAGIEETKNTLRYYTETLRWITPEVYFELDKFLRGMSDLETADKKAVGVRDHIVSLYFISKLNEKVLDSRLTKAVLQIIKEK